MGPGSGAWFASRLQASGPPWPCRRAASEKGLAAACSPRSASRPACRRRRCAIPSRSSSALTRRPSGSSSLICPVASRLETPWTKRVRRRGSRGRLGRSRIGRGSGHPDAERLEAIRRKPEFAGWTFGVITLDPDLLDDTTEHVNITLPRRVLRRLDALARAAGESRSQLHRTVDAGGAAPRGVARGLTARIIDAEAEPATCDCPIAWPHHRQRVPDRSRGAATHMNLL